MWTLLFMSSTLILGSLGQEVTGRAAAMGHASIAAGSAANADQFQSYQVPPPMPSQYQVPQPVPSQYQAPSPPPTQYQAPSQGLSGSQTNSGGSGGILPQVFQELSPDSRSYSTPLNLSPGTAQNFQRALTALENVRQSLITLASTPAPTCPDGCDLARWKKCTCISPATYDNEGRGNCNLGASKLDTKVWCYVDPRMGDARVLCPDAQPSPTKPGYYWSRFACIT